MNNKITDEYHCDNNELISEYQKFIFDKRPYKYHITISFMRNYKLCEMYKRLNFLFKVLSRNIYNNNKSEILLQGFCFIESSNGTSRCSKHCHILIKDDPKLDATIPFEDNFYKSLERVKIIINGQCIDKPEIVKECVCIQPVDDVVPLIKYVTKEFWNDPSGDFIKMIDKHGIVV